MGAPPAGVGMIARHRATSRILVVDPSGRILMFYTLGSVPAQPTRWLTPGGGVDPGESHHEAAVRELFEETGLAVDDLGEPVFAFDFDVDYTGGDHDTGHAEFYVLHTDRFVPSDTHWTDDERIDVLAHRWWSLDELRETTESWEPPMLLDLIAQHATPTPLSATPQDHRKDRSHD
ncbi:NUDIX hydrolase [Marisediminicola sp. LYQ134]|uniref:NUDIX hydrolase n=1 Tax=Marisediminicola sp. LYQ134 TaxID=3391061 RepID=UPI0039833B17